MNTAPEQFTAANKAAAEGLIGVANAQFAMFERLASLNLNATRSAYEDLINYVCAASSAKDPQGLINLNASAAEPTLEKVQAYAREVYELVAQSQAELTKLVEAQASDANKGFASLLDQYSKSGPAGSDVAFAALKSALAAANKAFESYSQFAKQTTELAAAASHAAKEAHKKAAA